MLSKVLFGTQIYDAKRGSFVDLGILDVQQIFGRAGRPQFDTYGHGMIITTHDKLPQYLSLLTRQSPIESQFIESLVDNLNAEICLGTITNLEEASQWLQETYLYVRMRANPQVYGISYLEYQEDRTLGEKRRKLIIDAARDLDKARMIRFDEKNGFLHSTDLGRTASHYYIKYATIETINELLKSQMTEDTIFSMLSKAQEFDQIKVRDDELGELDDHLDKTCQLRVLGGTENGYGKVNILLQTYIGRASIDSFSLVSDQAYVAQNAGRIARAVFEIALKKGMAIMSGRLLNVCKLIERRLWPNEHPLYQFGNTISFDILRKLQPSLTDPRKRGNDLSLIKLKEMDSKEIGLFIRHPKMGSTVKSCAHQIPMLDIETTIQPITRTVLRVRLLIKPDFRWEDRVHGNGSEIFWIWVEDPETDHIYHVENYLVSKKQAKTREEQTLVFTIPINQDPLPSQYVLRCISDRWLGSDNSQAVSFKHLILPDHHLPHTALLDLHPLPKTVLKDKNLEALYPFDHFNPIQTQVFHPVYHTDCNVLLGAPTGSGKTIVAELAMFRVFREYPNAKCVYIAPLKALVRERVDDWKIRLQEKLGKNVVELTGDVAPDMKSVANADVIVTTPEKWDGISRSWQTRSYVKSVRLLVIDEIHLLGDDRGPVLEVIVSRTNFISSHTDYKVRVVGLSTALANARDLADWLGIKTIGLFNFRPSVRPVPLEAHIHGFPGKHYCPRMATMNKPAFQGIKLHSPEKPVLIFVSSRRQTRLTALDLISFLAADDNPQQWLNMPENEMENLISGVKEQTLKLTLSYGIGLHHAGLVERDRKTVEELFVNQKIQILIATSTLAWGVNFPAHLVIIKGTEYFDGKQKRYVDFPITDVLQMMGRAGRPQFDNEGKALIFVHDQKKHFYKKFLYEPFPVESNLLAVLPEHLNAEIVAGTIQSKQEAMDYITWTYFFRRLIINPSYYDLEDTDHGTLNVYLSKLVEKCIQELALAGCVTITEDGLGLQPTDSSRIASYYYLSHFTMKMFDEKLNSNCELEDLIEILSNCQEYAELPVRHNEDKLNSDLAQDLPISLASHAMDSSHTKAHLLLQAHFSHANLPCSDYATDTKSVMDQAIRILQAMLDTCAGQGWLVTSIRIINLIQMIIQARWLNDSTLLVLPHIDSRILPKLAMLKNCHVRCLPELMHYVERNGKSAVYDALRDDLGRPAIDDIFKALGSYPKIDVIMSVKGILNDGLLRDKRIENMHESGPNVSDKKWLQVSSDTEYTLNLSLISLNMRRRKENKAFAPFFPKPKDEGWIIIIGDVDKKELVALKRVNSLKGKETKTSIVFYTPEDCGRVIYSVYVLSDAYLGLDQQYDLHLEVQDISNKPNDDYDEEEL
ncbi:DgyrCDS10545 [Dimorphilus gyrociliatus]|uniref:DgyrCDS10545 n=1 Tax=Dimorphilus gyrociliatus TaxID=2664684 RepID=A0A7I8W1X8_9ANNE|nr:DgyrCDS10545 [Dimorphilus gyrociliatus]